MSADEERARFTAPRPSDPDSRLREIGRRLRLWKKRAAALEAQYPREGPFRQTPRGEIEKEEK